MNPENEAQTVAEEARETTESLEEIIRRAQEEPSVVPQIEELLKSPSMMEALGDLSSRVELAMVAAVSGGDLFAQEALLKKLAAMRAELAGPNPTPLERQLVERVVRSWLAVHDAEFRAVHNPDQGDCWQRRIDHAHRRHLSAIKALATIRKLAVPVIIGQVNVAQRQVNEAQINAAGL